MAEAQTMTDIKWTAASAVVLYFCKNNQGLVVENKKTNRLSIAPHLVEYVSKLF